MLHFPGFWFKFRFSVIFINLETSLTLTFFFSPSYLRMDVEKGKIEDTGGSGGSYSIKTQFNSEEQWTKALKFMLTNLKWGLAWVTSQFYNR